MWLKEYLVVNVIVQCVFNRCLLEKSIHVLTLLTRRDTLRCHFMWLKEYLVVNVIVQCVFNRCLLK